MEKSTRRKSLRSTLIILVILATSIIFLCQGIYSFILFDDKITDSVGNTLQVQAEKEALHLSNSMSQVGNISYFLARDLEKMLNYSPQNTQILVDIINGYIAKEDVVYGSGFWFEPYQYDKTQKFYGPYVVRGQAGIDWQYSNESYNYLDDPWYMVGIKTKNRVGYTEPYFDPGSNVNMITSASPIYRNGKVIGCTTADFNMGDFQQYLDKQVKVGEKGLAFVVTREGRYLSYKPDPDKNLKEKELIYKDAVPGLQRLGKAVMAANDPGILKDGKKLVEIDLQKMRRNLRIK